MRIDVVDRGLGIAPGDVERLFTRFGRIVTADNRHIRGTGLGLYLTREIIRLHGGNVTADSRLEEGSTFCVRLPVAR